MLAAVGVAVFDRRHDAAQAYHLLAHLSWRWLVVAICAEVASIVVFGCLERWLLRAGGVKLSLASMTEIVLAGNALSTTLPGGVAWSSAWAYGQLRRRGANRVLSGWVLLVAGALESFALFVVLDAGVFVAGSRGPVSHLRPLAVALAALAVLVGLAAVALPRWSALRGWTKALWAKVVGWGSWLQRLDKALRHVTAQLRTVRVDPVGWLQPFGLALANWAFDGMALVTCILAVGAPVPWRGLLVIYGLGKLVDNVPITPGGIGIVEGSLTALLVAYGMPASQALAATLLYRVVSFWGLVPLGYAAWGGLALAQRKGKRTKPHPWAVHLHGPDPADPGLNRQGPGRVLPPEPCLGCDGEDGVPASEPVGKRVARRSVREPAATASKPGAVGAASEGRSEASLSAWRPRHRWAATTADIRRCDRWWAQYSYIAQSPCHQRGIEV